MKNEADLGRIDPDIIDTIHALFPGAHITLDRRAEGRASFRFVPALRHPHLLVPADAPIAASNAVDRRSAKDTSRQILARWVVQQILRNPSLARRLMPDVLQVGPSVDTFLDHLEGVTGASLNLSLAIGSRRANRKPVMSVHTVEGSEVGYAKVGLTPLANSLIDDEASTLLWLAEAPPTHFTAPTVIHHGVWHDCRVLLMRSLRPMQRPAEGGVPVQALAEIAARGGVTWSTLAESPWLAEMRVEAEHLATAGRPRFGRALAEYARVFADVQMPLGSWHGDLGPWNMAWEGDKPQIWDWERSQRGTPLGIDAAHFVCHATLRDIGNLKRAREALWGPGTQALGQVHARLGIDIPNPRSGRAVLLGYLVAVAARFSVDATRPDGDLVGAMADWYVMVLLDQLAEEAPEWN